MQVPQDGIQQLDGCRGERGFAAETQDDVVAQGFQAVGEFGHQGRLTRAGFAAQEDGTVAVVGQAREEGGDVCLSAVETAPAPAGDFEMAAVLSGGCFRLSFGDSAVDDFTQED